jgi:ubiquinone/menaquinone biosynthesis C-methylase UbiE
LIAARRRSARSKRAAPVHWIEAAGERLPLRSSVFSSVIALGNIISFASVDGRALVTELARVTKPGGSFIGDFASPVGATQEFFHYAARHRFLPRVLRRRRFYFLDQVLADGFQPYAPHRLGRWEFKFYTAEEAVELLRATGFRVVDIMSIAPVARMDERIIASAHRRGDTWRSLLQIEEIVGRRPGVFESGDGFIVCAKRSSEPARG